MTTFRAGYGDFTYGNLLYGIDAELVLGDPAVNITSTVNVSGQLIKQVAASDTSTSSATASGYTAIAATASTSCTSSLDLYWNRVRPFAADENLRATQTSVARYKWLPSSDPVTSWTASNYLERAA